MKRCWRITLVATACIAAAALILLGIREVLRDVHASWYLDGGVFYEDSGLEVIFSDKPLRIGNVLMDWRGPVCLLTGLLMALSVHQLQRRP